MIIVVDRYTVCRQTEGRKYKSTMHDTEESSYCASLEAVREEQSDRVGIFHLN